jgi:hypothetical protein
MHHSADRGIEAGAIAARGENAYFFDRHDTCRSRIFYIPVLLLCRRP